MTVLNVRGGTGRDNFLRWSRFDWTKMSGLFEDWVGSVLLVESVGNEPNQCKQVIVLVLECGSLLFVNWEPSYDLQLGSSIACHCLSFFFYYYCCITHRNTWCKREKAHRNNRRQRLIPKKEH